jgi:hypothetical protein
VIADAADRLSATGAPVQVPKFAASESMAGQRAATGLRNVPFAGDPIVARSERAIEQLGAKADEIAQGFGGALPEQAGATAARGINNWIKGKSAQHLDNLYGEVEKRIDPGIQTELNATRNTVATLAHENTQAGLPRSGAVGLVLEAVQRPGGLTYAGIRKLRTRLGEMIDDGVLPADVSGAELKRVYGALTEDLRKAAENAGGKAGLAAFERANAAASRVAKRREDLAGIVGLKGDASARHVFDRIRAAATSTSRQDSRLLMRARAALSRDEWNDMAAGVVSTLGRKNGVGEFNPHEFMRQYNLLSTTGKQLLFRTTGRNDLARALDDISTVSRAFQRLQKFANPSGTAQNQNLAQMASSIARNVTVGTGAMMIIGPVQVVAGVVGARGLAHVLSSPATAKSMAMWARVYHRAVMNPTRGALKLMQQSSRQFGDSLGRTLGLDANSVATKLYGTVQGAADEHQNEAKRVVND